MQGQSRSEVHRRPVRKKPTPRQPLRRGSPADGMWARLASGVRRVVGRWPELSRGRGSRAKGDTHGKDDPSDDERCYFGSESSSQLSESHERRRQGDVGVDDGMDIGASPWTKPPATAAVQPTPPRSRAAKRGGPKQGQGCSVPWRQLPGWTSIEGCQSTGPPAVRPAPTELTA